ncbi:MAG TPA: DUF72 domain-containing protein [Candidatus Angelobacter sp.]|nr:DUF72 domain-containing protein [Candidatus Angelobacter sp.]
MAKILVGTAGFSYPDWKGIVYPLDLKKRKIHELEYLAQFFECCEINNSFYRPLDPKIAKRWCDYVAPVNERFQFTAKLTNVFTHAPQARTTSSSAETIKYTHQDVEDAKAGFDPLMHAGKLATVLLQFPISYKYTEGNWDHLIDVAHLFKSYPLAVEVRHESWAAPLVLKALSEEKIAFCNIDQPRLGETLEGTKYVTAPVGYMRLHGRNYQKWFQGKNRDERYNYLYGEKELDEISERVREMSERAARVIVIANNHYKGQAVVNGLQLKKLFDEKNVKAPEELVKTYPGLKEFVIQ